MGFGFERRVKEQVQTEVVFEVNFNTLSVKWHLEIYQGLVFEGDCLGEIAPFIRVISGFLFQLEIFGEIFHLDQNLVMIPVCDRFFPFEVYLGFESSIKRSNLQVNNGKCLTIEMPYKNMDPEKLHFYRKPNQNSKSTFEGRLPMSDIL